MSRKHVALVLALLLAGCSSGRSPGAPAPATAQATAPATMNPAPATLTPTPLPAPVTTTATTAVAASTVASQGSVRLDVEAPGWTSSNVFVAIDQPTNGKPAWAPDAIALVQDAQGRWRGTLPVTGGSVSWKLTRGSWSTVEKGPEGEELPDRKSATGLVHAHVFHWGDDTILPPASSIRDLGDFTPRALGTARHVYAHLPPGYDVPANAGTRYPVLYALDGQNLFDPSRSFGGVAWGLDTAADAHVAAGRSAFICIAIDNTQARIDEYTPSPDGQYGGGRLEDFASFIFEELKPAIDTLYRTRSGPDDTGVLGSSLGGLAAFHLGWKHPDQVRRIGAISPSLWWNNEETKGLIQSTPARPPLRRLRVDIGTNEGGNPRAILDQTRAVAALLGNMGFGSDFDYAEIQGASHDEASWAARLPDILAFLFP